MSTTINNQFLAVEQINDMELFMTDADQQQTLTVGIYNDNWANYRLQGKLKDILQFIADNDYQIIRDNTIFNQQLGNSMNERQAYLSLFQLKMLEPAPEAALSYNQMFINVSLNNVTISTDEDEDDPDQHVMLPPQSICYFKQQTSGSPHWIFQLTTLSEAYTELYENQMMLVNMSNHSFSYLLNQHSAKLTARGQVGSFVVLNQQENILSILDKVPVHLEMLCKNRDSANRIPLPHLLPATLFMKSGLQHLPYIEKYSFKKHPHCKHFVPYQDVHYYNYTDKAIKARVDPYFNGRLESFSNALFNHKDCLAVAPIEACAICKPWVNQGVLINRLKLNYRITDLAQPDCWLINPALNIQCGNAQHIAQGLALFLKSQFADRVTLPGPNHSDCTVSLPAVKVQHVKSLFYGNVLDIDQLCIALQPIRQAINEVTQAICDFEYQNHQQIVVQDTLTHQFEILCCQYPEYIMSMMDSYRRGKLQLYQTKIRAYQKYLSRLDQIAAQLFPKIEGKLSQTTSIAVHVPKLTIPLAQVPQFIRSHVTTETPSRQLDNIFNDLSYHAINLSKISENTAFIKYLATPESLFKVV